MNMQQSKLNHSYVERFIYSTQFRSLQDKTQLFYPSQKQRVRTRLTHTLEVRLIAHKIAGLLTEEIEKFNTEQASGANVQPLLPPDPELVDAIALAHDIGHTPFGHVGERTIDAVVSGKDTLDGLVPYRTEPTMRFKHNSNAVRILVGLDVKDWRITEGALSHTRVYYKGDSTKYAVDPYHPLAKADHKNLIKFISGQNKLHFSDAKKSNPPSLTLEGQIVAVADEIAQRAADLGDAKIKSRYLDNIEQMFRGYVRPGNCPKASRSNPYSRLEWVILTAMTADVATETFARMQQHTPVEQDHKGITHGVYTDKIAAFSPEMEQINEVLDKFVSSFLAQSEEVREADSRSKYIIRQLYKAYINDVTLLPDEFLDTHLDTIGNSSAFDEARSSVDPVAAPEVCRTFRSVKRKKWYMKSSITNGFSRQLLNMGVVKDYFGILKANSQADTPNLKITFLFDAFLLDVGFYIGGMTNTEAYDAYNRIYGYAAQHDS